MTTEKAIKMIDEYLLEPNNIDQDWVEVLCLCRQVLHRDVNDVCPKCGHKINGGEKDA